MRSAVLLGLFPVCFAASCDHPGGAAHEDVTSLLQLKSADVEAGSKRQAGSKQSVSMVNQGVCEKKYCDNAFATAAENSGQSNPCDSPLCKECPQCIEDAPQCGFECAGLFRAHPEARFQTHDTEADDLVLCDMKRCTGCEECRGRTDPKRQQRWEEAMDANAARAARLGKRWDEYIDTLSDSDFHSLSDDDLTKQFDEYLDSLSDSEYDSLWAFKYDPHTGSEYDPLTQETHLPGDPKWDPNHIAEVRRFVAAKLWAMAHFDHRHDD